MDKVDALLEEIYFEMQMEELEEDLDNFLSDDYDFSLLAEEQPPVDPAKVQAAAKAIADRMAAAKEAGKSELVKQLASQYKSAMQKVNLAKFKWSRFKATSGISAAKTKAGEIAGKAVEKGKEVAAPAVEKGKELIKQAGKTDTGKAVAKAAGQAKEFVGQHHQAAAGVATAAVVVAAIAASVAIYKKFFSQAAKACKDKKGPEKKACVKSFKAKGLQAAKSKLSAGMSKCKDPKCKAKIQKKMQGFDAKISALKESLSEDIINSYVGDYLAEEFENDLKN